MLRIASLTLVIGAVLLLTWVLASARPHRADAVVVEPQEPVTMPLAEVAADIARLQKRLPAPPPYAKPERDPFRFGRTTDVIAAPPPPPVVAAPAPPLPRLVAILSDTVNGAIVRRAALRVESAVRILGVGDMAGALRVSAITPDGVDLVDPATGGTFRVPLR